LLEAAARLSNTSHYPSAFLLEGFMRHLLVLGFMAVFPLGLSGCSPLGSPTEGELDRLAFSYSPCLFDCTGDQPVMAGTTEVLSVSGDGFSGEFTVTSSAPEIADFTLINDDSVPRNIRMVTRAPGNVSLQIHQGGELLDFVSFSVRAPRAIRLELAEDATHAEQKSLTLKVGDASILEAIVTGSLGEELRADSGLVWSVDSDEIATILASFGSSSAQQDGIFGSPQGVKPGETILRVKAGETAGQSLSLKVVQ
jgi:uncharacterized protein (UPF0147 family)